MAFEPPRHVVEFSIGLRKHLAVEMNELGLDEDPHEYMDDWAFRRYHRLSREAFDHLLELISSDLEPVSRRWARGHLASPIDACTQLSVALRILVGGSYLDVSHSHRVSRPTCFSLHHR